MSNHTPPPPGTHGHSDEQLLAYVDGGLDADERAQLQAEAAAQPELAARLAAMAGSVLPYAQAFSMDRAAHTPPPATLQAWLQTSAQASAPAAANDSQPRSAPLQPAAAQALAQRSLGRRHFLRRWIPAGAAAAAGVAGGFVGGLAWRGSAAPVPQLAQTQAPWVMPIAQYQALYGVDTVATATEAADRTQWVLRQFAARAAQLGHSSSATVPDLRSEGLRFVRAQVLKFEAQPLLQLAYAHNSGAPLALCVLPDAQAGKGAAANIQTVQLQALNATWWRANGSGHVLAAELPSTQLQRISAGLLASRYAPLVAVT